MFNKYIRFSMKVRANSGATYEIFSSIKNVLDGSVATLVSCYRTWY